MKLSLISQLLLDVAVVTLEYFFIAQELVARFFKTTQFFSQSNNFLFHLAVIDLVLFLYLISLLQFPR
jgi:hypothetical protein